MAEPEIHIVPVHTTPQRLQEYGVGLFEVIPTRSAFKKAIKRNQIRVDGEIAQTATIIKGGETIVFTPPETHSAADGIGLKLEVLFEDDYLAAAVKPPGILVSGNKFRTLSRALPGNLKASRKADAVRPQPVHRLDYATSGILLVGKTSESIRSLNKMFEHQKIEKTYYAVTIGPMEESGRISDPVDDKEAITHYGVESTVVSPRFRYLNLVRLKPGTGRRHQLRIHLAGMGNPILGDRDYTPEPLLLKGKGMYLHAFSLQFVHPFTRKRLDLAAPLPERFTRIFKSQ